MGEDEGGIRSGRIDAAMNEGNADRGPAPNKTTHTLTRPLCSVDAPPVVILLLAAIDAPESSAAATIMGAEATRSPTESESRAEAMR